MNKIGINLFFNLQRAEFESNNSNEPFIFSWHKRRESTAAFLFPFFLKMAIFKVLTFHPLS